MAAPERIRVCIRAGKEDWIGVAYAAETDNPSTVHEYARIDRKYFCSCGGALTAEEYITHYFELGHDHGINVKSPASAAPVVDNDALGSAVVNLLNAFHGSGHGGVDYMVSARLRGCEKCSTLATILDRAMGRSPVAATAAPQQLFEAKLLGFGEGDRIRLCEPCLTRAIDEHLVSFSSALPAAPVAKSNREPHAFQEHPLYPNYCAFAVGDEDYCKRETDNVIHQVTTAAPVEQSDEAVNLLNEIDKTARQLLRPNRTPTDIDFAVEYIVSRVTALRRAVAKT